jgi:SAM-dependent methyltransferase
MSQELRGSASWEDFARRDALYYIDPTLGPGVDLDEFREGGRGIVEWAVDWAGQLPDHGHALEIGCGVGRNTVHLARHFQRVEGVDVSPTMVRSALSRGVPPNVRLHALSGRDLQPLPDATFALVFSHLVFQHIESGPDIAAYLRETARVLRRGGVAVLHFDTRPMSPLIRLGQRLPDPLLPRDRRRGIRRHRRAAGQIRGYGEAAGLVLEAELDPGTAHHWFRWRRP